MLRPYSLYPSSITLAGEYSERPDFVGAKHCGDQSIVKAESVDTAMRWPFFCVQSDFKRYIVENPLNWDDDEENVIHERQNFVGAKHSGENL